jgi:hypothetical protein
MWEKRKTGVERNSGKGHMGKRDAYVMVPEDDLRWMRFWDAYPRRCAKKEARRIWVKLDPSALLVDTMVEALRWQTPLWAKDDFRYAPHPSTWLHNERWKDEPPMSAQRVMSEAASLVFSTLGVKP